MVQPDRKPEKFGSIRRVETTEKLGLVDFFLGSFAQFEKLSVADRNERRTFQSFLVTPFSDRAGSDCSVDEGFTQDGSSDFETVGEGRK